MTRLCFSLASQRAIWIPSWHQALGDVTVCVKSRHSHRTSYDFRLVRFSQVPEPEKPKEECRCQTSWIQELRCILEPPSHHLPAGRRKLMRQQGSTRSSSQHFLLSNMAHPSYLHLLIYLILCYIYLIEYSVDINRNVMVWSKFHAFLLWYYNSPKFMKF